MKITVEFDGFMTMLSRELEKSFTLTSSHAGNARYVVATAYANRSNSSLYHDGNCGFVVVSLHFISYYTKRRNSYYEIIIQ